MRLLLSIGCLATVATIGDANLALAAAPESAAVLEEDGPILKLFSTSPPSDKIRTSDASVVYSFTFQNCTTTCSYSFRVWFRQLSGCGTVLGDITLTQSIAGATVNDRTFYLTGSNLYVLALATGGVTYTDVHGIQLSDQVSGFAGCTPVSCSAGSCSSAGTAGTAVLGHF